MRNRFTAPFAAICVCLLASSVLGAQLTTSTILGTVTDPSRATVASAKVTATNTGTNFTRAVETNPQGEYRMEFMPIGSYIVEVTAPGFKKFSQSGIVLAVNVDGRVNASLQVGQASEVVNVTGDAPQINTSNAQIG